MTKVVFKCGHHFIKGLSKGHRQIIREVPKLSFIWPVVEFYLSRQDARVECNHIYFGVRGSC